MVPAESSRFIAPVHLEVVIELPDVAAAVSGEKETVLVIRLPVDLGVQVVKAHRSTVETGSIFHIQIGIRATAGDDEGGFVFYNRRLQRQLGRQQTDTAAGGKLFGVAIAGSYFQQRRQAATVF